MKRRILIADDSERTRQQLRCLLETDSQFQVETVAEGLTALKALQATPCSLFLTDLKMPGLDGMQLIEKIHALQIPVAVIVMTGHGSIAQAVEAMRLGASDFLTKPIDPDHLRLVIDRALRERSLLDELTQLRERMTSEFAFQNVLSKNPRMHALFELINHIAPTTTTVLIEGETGTGKEEVARAIHLASQPFRKGAFVAVNCAALPATLLESELFGHEKGSYTGADRLRRGRFELAHGGTLFLDEVGDIPQPMQIKLLRVLQERCFERIGGTESLQADVRFIAATNRSLKRLVRKGEFREDLYYRLNVVRFQVPPLRERPEDVPLLATHFVSRYARPGEGVKAISAEAMERLLGYSWPGNVRQLENAIERACVTAHGALILPEDLPPELRPKTLTSPNQKIDLKKPLPDLLRELTIEVEKQYLRKALQQTRGNIGRCARLCGLSRRSISAKLAEYQIDKEQFKFKEE